jgi:hypothetical protein
MNSMLGSLHLMICEYALGPNPSIERTNNGGSQLHAFARAQPPLFASHLKRWASLTKHRAMRSSVVPSVAGQVLLAWPSTKTLVPSFTASDVFVARPRSVQARCSWSAAAATVPTGVASRGFASPACRARAHSMHRWLSSQLVSRRGRPALPEAGQGQIALHAHGG